MQNEAESQPPSLPQNNDAPHQQSSAMNIADSQVVSAVGSNNGTITITNNTNNNTTNNIINNIYHSENKIIKKSPPRVWLPINKSKLCQYFEIELKLRGIVTSSEYATDYDYYVVWCNQIEPAQEDHTQLPWIQSNIAQQKVVFTENIADIHQYYQTTCKILLYQSKSIDSENTAQAHARTIAKQLIADKFNHNSNALALEFQSERPFNLPIEADLALDWYVYQQNVNANTDTWQRGQEALYDLREWVGDAHPLTLNTKCLGYFPALLFGSIFYRTSAYKLNVLNYNNEWQLSIHTKPSDHLAYSMHTFDENSTNCILNICIANSQPSNLVIQEMNTYSSKYIKDVGIIISIYPKDHHILEITHSNQASEIIGFIIATISKLPKRYYTYQLLISAPAALVVLLGQRINGYYRWVIHKHIKELENDCAYQLIDFPIIAQANPNRSIS